MKILRIAPLILAIEVVAAQQPAPGSLRGVVVTAGTGDAIANATVQLRSATSVEVVATTTTDGDGTFLFPRVPHGSYRLVATRAGYMKAEYGQPKAGAPGLDITVGGDRRTADLRLVMTPGGVISGRVTDRGEPSGLASVVALKSTYHDGWRTMTPVLSARTNDLGEYSLFWLPPGEYYVATIVFDIASPATLFGNLLLNPDGDSNSFFAQRTLPRAVLNRANLSRATDSEIHVPIYFPGTPDARQASVIAVRAGAEVPNVNLDATPQPTRRVEGILQGVLPLTDAEGRPVRQLVSLAMLDLPFPIFNQPGQILIDVDPSGPFEFPRVAPGVYALYSSQPGGKGTRINIDVRDHDLVGITLTLDQRFTITGRVIVDADTPLGSQPNVTDLRVTLRSDPPLPSMTSTTVPTMADGTFRIASLGGNDRALRAGNYRVSVAPILMPPTIPGTAPPAIPPALRGVYVQSIRMGNTDVLNDGIRLESQPQEEMVIVVGANGGVLRGRVLNDEQQPISSASVVLIPEGGRRFRVDHSFTSSDDAGQFQFAAVPPGDYKVLAWQDVERGKWQDPDFVREYQRLGKPVRIEAGRSQDDVVILVIAQKR